MIDMASRTKQRRTLGLALTISLAACSGPEAQSADLVLTGGSLYSFAWDAPGPDGTPALAAPFSVTEGWRSDATAIAMRDNEILFVGDDAGAETFVGASMRVVDLDGETILPGLVDSNTHVAALGRNLERIDLVGIDSEEEAVRAYTSGAAYAVFLEEETGVLTPGRWADVTVLSIDPLRVATGDTPEDLFDGRVVMTIVGSVIAYEAPNTVNR